MTRDEVIGKLLAVMHDIFDDDDILYREDLTAADVDGWDSLSNVTFIVAVERAFGCRLTSGEMERLARLGDLVDLLEKRS